MTWEKLKILEERSKGNGDDEKKKKRFGKIGIILKRAKKARGIEGMAPSCVKMSD